MYVFEKIATADVKKRGLVLTGGAEVNKVIKL